MKFTFATWWFAERKKTNSNKDEAKKVRIKKNPAFLSGIRKERIKHQWMFRVFVYRFCPIISLY
jgi:hypothetical protein